MDIIIPTSGRAGAQPSLAQLTAAGLRTTLVVQAREHAEYSKYKSALVDVMALPPRIQTISPTRQYILDAVGTADRFVMVDDDLTFYKRRDDDRTKLRHITPVELAGAFEELAYQLKALHAHAGFASREGANRNTEPYAVNTRIMRVLGYNRDFLRDNKLRFDRTEFMQDFDMNLQILRAGGGNIVLNNYAHNQGSSNAPGGCSVVRTMDKLTAAAHRLKELHPDFVQIRQKATKSAWGGGTRTDVTVSWKKAHASSQKQGVLL